MDSARAWLRGSALCERGSGARQWLERPRAAFTLWAPDTLEQPPAAGHSLQEKVSPFNILRHPDANRLHAPRADAGPVFVLRRVAHAKSYRNSVSTRMLQ